MDPDILQCVLKAHEDLAKAKKKEAKSDCPYVDSSGRVFVGGFDGDAIFLHEGCIQDETPEYRWMDQYLAPSVNDHTKMHVSKSGLLVIKGDIGIGRAIDWNDSRLSPEVKACIEEGNNIIEEGVSRHCAFHQCTDKYHRPGCSFESDLKYYDSTECLPHRLPYQDILQSKSSNSSDESTLEPVEHRTEILWKNPHDIEWNKKRPDTSLYSNREEMYKRIVKESNFRLKRLEKQARELELVLDADIITYMEKKKGFFNGLSEKVGFDANRFDCPPIYSPEVAYDVKFGVWEVQDTEQLLSWSREDVVQNFFCRAHNLKSFVAVAKSDLDRLRLKRHDGKSSRLFPAKVSQSLDGTSLKSGEANYNKRPWYLCLATETKDVSVWSGRANDMESECEFCNLDRNLHELEFEMERLFKYTRRWPNCNYLPCGAKDALLEGKRLVQLTKPARRTRSQGLDSDSDYHSHDSIKWKEVAKEDQSKYERGPDSMHLGRGPYWEFDRLKEGFVRISNQENRAQMLEKKLDEDVKSYLIAKEAFFCKFGGHDETPNYSDNKPHVLKFSYFGRFGTLVLAMQAQERKHVILDLFQRVECLQRFQKVAKMDLDRLWNKTHDGKSCRYFGKATPYKRDRISPQKPWYLVDGIRSWTLQELANTALDKCLFCLLDDKIRRIEKQAVTLEKYCRRWPNSKTKPKGALDVVQIPENQIRHDKKKQRKIDDRAPSPCW